MKRIVSFLSVLLLSISYFAANLPAKTTKSREAPSNISIVCPAPFTIEIYGTNCTTYLELPPAQITDACSNYSVMLFYKLETPFGVGVQKMLILD